ncbi:hypothetical protein ACHAWU_003676 [Discostella pseudostelligera]|uniref:Transmembrane protein n=1 Tax=Discostella pseudostelligera TaxID=259834 RepID=A0ABD3MAF6_9STRA
MMTRMRSPASPSMSLLLLLAVFASTLTAVLVSARPIVRHIRSTHEFDRLMKKHATQTGLPVILSTSTPTVVVPVE